MQDRILEKWEKVREKKRYIAGCPGRGITCNIPSAERIF